VNNENRIKHLKKELDVLKGKVDKEKTKLKAMQQKANQPATENPRNMFVDFPINSKFVLNEDEAAYGLSIEIQVYPDAITKFSL
jgi:mRNA-degrading endonuclease HigB of HigAB toxin-antitoxin module